MLGQGFQRQNPGQNRLGPSQVQAPDRHRLIYGPGWDQNQNSIQPFQGLGANIPGYAPDRFAEINAQFPEGQRPFIQGALGGYSGAQGYNQDALNKALGFYGGARGDINDLYHNQFQNLNQGTGQNQSSLMALQTQLGNTMKVDPYSDQLRQQNLGGIQDQIAREQQSNINQVGQQFAGRGLYNSTNALGAESAIRGAGMQANAAAANQSLMDQLQVNVPANTQRAGLLGNLGLGIGNQNLQGMGLQNQATDSYGNQISGLTGGQAYTQMQGRMNPMDMPNMMGGFYGAMIGNRNFDASQGMMQQIIDQNRPNIWKDLGGLFQGIAPGNLLAQFGGGALQTVPNWNQPGYWGGPR